MKLAYKYTNQTKKALWSNQTNREIRHLKSFSLTCIKVEALTKCLTFDCPQFLVTQLSGLTVSKVTWWIKKETAREYQSNENMTNRKFLKLNEQWENFTYLCPLLFPPAPCYLMYTFWLGFPVNYYCRYWDIFSFSFFFMCMHFICDFLLSCSAAGIFYFKLVVSFQHSGQDFVLMLCVFTLENKQINICFHYK